MRVTAFLNYLRVFLNINLKSQNFAKAMDNPETFSIILTPYCEILTVNEANVKMKQMLNQNRSENKNSNRKDNVFCEEECILK